MLEFLDKYHRQQEIRRLENIKGDFLKEYKELCVKYKAQLVPRLLTLSADQIKIVQQIDIYDPEKIKQAMEAIKKENEQSRPNK